MTSFNPTPRPVFLYSETEDAWYEVSAKADTGSGYEWAGDHKFLASVISTNGINNFLNPTTRDLAFTSPERGSICLIRQDSSGNNINQLQVFDGTSWSSPSIDLEIKFIMGAD